MDELKVKPLEEGDSCPVCESEMNYIPDGPCSCHIHPPCSSCVNAPLKCTKCGYVEE